MRSISKPDKIETLPDIYTNQRYVMFMCVKPLYVLMQSLAKVLFFCPPDYKYFDLGVTL